MSNDQFDTSVLVVGAGLAGLTTAVALGSYGISVTVIERRTGVLSHPRADGFTPRTMEIFRSLGFSSSDIPEVDLGFKLRRTRVETLIGKWIEEVAWSTPSEQQAKSTNIDYSPYRGSTVPQDILEPTIRDRALSLGVFIQYGHELIDFSQTKEGVTAIVDGSSGSRTILKARYLIAADGHRSLIRDILHIPQSGHGLVSSIKSILFRAPSLQPYFRNGVTQFVIEQPDLKAFLIAYSDDRLVLHLPSHLAVNDDVQRSLMLKAIGTEDIDIEILGSSRWDMSAFVSERFSSGNVFLVGDAAHSLPPNRGGYGVNTGIADAHNLAWKLAHVLSGRSTSALLETYNAERKPVAWLRHDQIFVRTDYRTLQGNRAQGSDTDGKIIEDTAMEFGELYRSIGIMGSGSSLPPAQRPDQWAGQPGTRAPHISIQRDGQTISSVDLFRGSWVLLAQKDFWESLLDQAKTTLAADVVFVKVTQIEPTPLSFTVAFGISSDGASLVRPDGYIVWRLSAIPDDAAPLLQALRQAMFVP